MSWTRLLLKVVAIGPPYLSTLEHQILGASVLTGNTAKNAIEISIFYWKNVHIPNPLMYSSQDFPIKMGLLPSMGPLKYLLHPYYNKFIKG